MFITFFSFAAWACVWLLYEHGVKYRETGEAKHLIAAASLLGSTFMFTGAAAVAYFRFGLE